MFKCLIYKDAYNSMAEISSFISRNELQYAICHLHFVRVTPISMFCRDVTNF